MYNQVMKNDVSTGIVPSFYLKFMYADNMIIRNCSSHSSRELKQKQDFSNIKTT